MKRLLLTLLLWPTLALGQLVPSCYPTLDPDKAYPARLPFVLYRTDGMALYWYCWSGSQWLATFRSLPADAVPFLLAKTGEASLDAMLAKAVKAITEAPDPRAKINEITASWAEQNHSCADAIATGATDKALCQAVFAAMAANVPPPRSRYTVAGTGERPTYAPQGSALRYPSNGTVTAGTPCNCTISVGKDPYRYCSVNNRADTLALCKVAP